jgi:hypothetical protein
MNGGSARGQAHGFQLQYLSKLSDVKAQVVAVVVAVIAAVMRRAARRMASKRL